MAETLQVQVDTALEMLPAEGEVNFEDFKASLYNQNPENGKAVLQWMMSRKLTKRRVQVVNGVPTVYLARIAPVTGDVPW